MNHTIRTPDDLSAFMMRLQANMKEGNRDIRTLGHSKLLHEAANALGFNNYHHYLAAQQGSEAPSPVEALPQAPKALNTGWLPDSLLLSTEAGDWNTDLRLYPDVHGMTPTKHGQIQEIHGPGDSGRFIDLLPGAGGTLSQWFGLDIEGALEAISRGYRATQMLVTIGDPSEVGVSPYCVPEQAISELRQDYALECDQVVFEHDVVNLGGCENTVIFMLMERV